MTTLSEIPAPQRRSTAIALNRAAYHFSRHWLAWFLAVAGLWVLLPWLGGSGQCHLLDLLLPVPPAPAALLLLVRTAFYAPAGADPVALG
jgi:hypothetical protein